MKKMVSVGVVCDCPLVSLFKLGHCGLLGGGGILVFDVLFLQLSPIAKPAIAMTIMMMPMIIQREPISVLPSVGVLTSYDKLTVFELNNEKVLPKYNVYAPDICAVNSKVVP